MAIVTVIDKAKELIDTVGKEKAIEYFEDRIKQHSPPKEFSDITKIAGAETAIEFIKKQK